MPLPLLFADPRSQNLIDHTLAHPLVILLTPMATSGDLVVAIIWHLVGPKYVGLLGFECIYVLSLYYMTVILISDRSVGGHCTYITHVGVVLLVRIIDALNKRSVW